MTLSYVYNKITEVMKEIEIINCDTTDAQKRRQNQKAIHKAYNILDQLKDELIRTSIKAKQKENI